ncbi:hypothetical protein IWZ01DRAFT_526202 [Phyllosticta capitalensis]
MGLRNVPLHARLSSPWMLRDDEHLSRPIISVLLPHLHLTSVPQLVISSPQRPTSPAVDASDLGASNATLLARATQGSAQLHRHESIPHHGLSRSPPNRFRPPMPLGEQSGGSHRAKGGPSTAKDRVYYRMIYKREDFQKLQNYLNTDNELCLMLGLSIETHRAMQPQAIDLPSRVENI